LFQVELCDRKPWSTGAVADAVAVTRRSGAEMNPSATAVAGSAADISGSGAARACALANREESSLAMQLNDTSIMVAINE